MDQEQVQVPACVLCGTKTGSYKFYHDAKDEDLYLCVDCLKSVTQSLTHDQLAGMTTARLKRHMQVRDELAATYRNSFVATKTFCVGKKRNVPILEVDEERGLWALPQAPMPLAQPIGSIADVEVSLSSDELGDDELSSEVVEGVQVKDLIPYLRAFFGKPYKSSHTDLAPIPEGHFVNYLNMVLTLDDQVSGLDRVEVDLLPFWISWPSHVDAGYDCAHELIVYLRQLASDEYKKMKTSGKGVDLSCSDRLAGLVAEGLVSDGEAETLRYYLERVPQQDAAGTLGSSYGLVRSVVDAVCDHIVFGEKVPDWKTRHTVGVETFLGAFYRYAPGLSVSDVVYIADSTRIQSGKGGLLFAQDSFAVDDFALDLGELTELHQPIPYDDLLFVGQGAAKGQLVLTYRDGTRREVNGGKYAHLIFAAVNCILLLRA